MELNTTLRQIGWKAMDHWRKIVALSRDALRIAAWRPVLAPFVPARLCVQGIPGAASMIWSG
jgi:hypothetical protein